MLTFSRVLNAEIYDRFASTPSSIYTHCKDSIFLVGLRYKVTFLPSMKCSVTKLAYALSYVFLGHCGTNTSIATEFLTLYVEPQGYKVSPPSTFTPSPSFAPRHPDQTKNTTSVSHVQCLYSSPLLKFQISARNTPYMLHVQPPSSKAVITLVTEFITFPSDQKASTMKMMFSSSPLQITKATSTCLSPSPGRI
jgi:hypothetical protein